MRESLEARRSLTDPQMALWTQRIAEGEKATGRRSKRSAQVLIVGSESQREKCRNANYVTSVEKRHSTQVPRWGGNHRRNSALTM